MFVFNRRPIEATPSPFVSLRWHHCCEVFVKGKESVAPRRKKRKSMDCLDARLAEGGRTWLNLVAPKEIKIRRQKRHPFGFNAHK